MPSNEDSFILLDFSKTPDSAFFVSIIHQQYYDPDEAIRPDIYTFVGANGQPIKVDQKELNLFPFTGKITFREGSDGVDFPRVEIDTPDQIGSIWERYDHPQHITVVGFQTVSRGYGDGREISLYQEKGAPSQPGSEKIRLWIGVKEPETVFKISELTKGRYIDIWR